MNVVEFVKAHPYWSGGIALVTFVLIWYLMSGSDTTTEGTTSTGSLSGDTAAASELAAAQITANAATAQAQIEAGSITAVAQLQADVDKAAIDADKAVALAENQSWLDAALAEAAALVGVEAYSSQTEIAKSNNEAAIALSTNAAAVQISENEVASTEFLSLSTLLGDYAKTNSVAGILDAYAPIADSLAGVAGDSDTSKLYSVSGIWQGLTSALGGGSAKSSGGSSYNTNTASQGSGGGYGSSVSGSSWGGFLSNTDTTVTSDPSKVTLSSTKFGELFDKLVNLVPKTGGGNTTGVTTVSKSTLDLSKINLGSLKDYKFELPKKTTTT
jgi:hypothetical protein